MKMIKTSAALALLASMLAGCGVPPEDDSLHRTWSDECDLRRLETPISVLERIRQHRREDVPLDLVCASLSVADLSGAYIERANLSGANLSYASLAGANLNGADLRGANLSYADLYGANLNGANLRGANLTGADLTGATLTDANLFSTNLTGANLRGANLRGANLHSSNLGISCETLCRSSLQRGCIC